MKPFQRRVKILSQKNIKGNYWHCEFFAPEIAKNALAGQFIDIRVTDRDEPLLRRPISIHKINGSKVSIFYEVVGRATQILAQKKAGEAVDIIGPLGNGFSVRKLKSVFLVAGGMGTAPLLFLAHALKKNKITVLIGAKTKEGLVCVQEFKKLGCEVKTSTDDGTAGLKGRVTDLLGQLLMTKGQQSTTIYACGPKPMLKAVTEIAMTRNVPAQLSLEEHMSCGIGACLGCVVKTKKGLKRVCKEGPVFEAKELVW